MNEELKGLKKLGTFKVLDGLPEGEKAIGSRWVLSYKSNKDGNITKTKARLVAEGVHAKRRRELPPNISTNTRRGIG